MARRKIPGNTRVDSVVPDVREPNLEDVIRKRAYELYLERGKADGGADEDWLRAEAEILRQHIGRDSESAA